jgi:hypothetical protein
MNSIGSKFNFLNESICNNYSICFVNTCTTLIYNVHSYNVCAVICTRNFTSGSISLKKSYGRFQFQIENTLHWAVQNIHNNVTQNILQYIKDSDSVISMYSTFYISTWLPKMKLTLLIVWKKKETFCFIASTKKSNNSVERIKKGDNSFGCEIKKE